MIKWMLLSLTAAVHVALVSQPGSFPDQGQALEAFLSSQTGTSTSVKLFYGDYEGLDEFQPQLVLDYSERLSDLQALVRRVPPSAAVRHSTYNLVAA
jgi:hypothetical protein